MNAGGTGARRSTCWWRPTCSTSTRRAARELRPSTLGLGYRSSALGPREIVVGAEFTRRADERRPTARPRSPRSCAGGASTSRAAPNGGSVFANPPGDSAGRLIDASGSRGCGSAGPWSRRSTPTSSRPSPAHRRRRVPPDRRGAGAGSGRDRRSTLVPEFRLVGFDDAPGEGMPDERAGMHAHDKNPCAAQGATTAPAGGLRSTRGYATAGWRRARQEGRRRLRVLIVVPSVVAAITLGVGGDGVTAARGRADRRHGQRAGHPGRGRRGRAGARGRRDGVARPESGGGAPRGIFLDPRHRETLTATGPERSPSR